MRKRGLSLLLTAAILTGTLTGCGNSGGGGNATHAGTTETAAGIDPKKISVVARGDYHVQDLVPAFS